MADRMRLAKLESRCGLTSHSRDIATSDEFWEAIRDAEKAITAGDLEALVYATERADSRSILRRRDQTECRKAAKALRRVCDGLQQLAGQEVTCAQL